MPVEIMEMMVRAMVDENRTQNPPKPEAKKQKEKPCTSENVSDQLIELMRRKNER